jgi:hypothetical protein
MDRAARQPAHRRRCPHRRPDWRARGWLVPLGLLALAHALVAVAALRAALAIDGRTLAALDLAAGGMTLVVLAWVACRTLGPLAGSRPRAGNRPGRCSLSRPRRSRVAALAGARCVGRGLARFDPRGPDASACGPRWGGIERVARAPLAPLADRRAWWPASSPSIRTPLAPRAARRASAGRRARVCARAAGPLGCSCWAGLSGLLGGRAGCSTGQRRAGCGATRSRPSPKSWTSCPLPGTGSGAHARRPSAPAPGRLCGRRYGAGRREPGRLARPALRAASDPLCGFGTGCAFHSGPGLGRSQPL